MNQELESSQASSRDAQQERLLATKLYVPQARPQLIARPQLLDLLMKGTSRDLTLVSAPAGFGKTTLLCEWVHQSKKSVGWLSLDAEDSDPHRLISYLVSAVQTIDPSVGRKALTALRSSHPPPFELVLTDLINELAGLARDVHLVLDDYHLVDSRQISRVMEFLLGNLPQSLHLIIASRADPQLPLARLRSRGQLTEVRASDLSFSGAETSVFLNKMNIRLSARDVSRLQTRTEGWIAGLQLAALSMQSRDDASAFIETFAGDDRHIVDYLAEEVLNQQSERVRNFLVRTSLLGRLSASLCDAVTGLEGSQNLLEELERTNLFVVPLDNKRQWYRYHRLFGDLLNRRLRQTRKELVPTLYQRAGQWCRDHGLAEEAIDYLLSARDYAAAVNLLEEKADTLWQRGESVRFGRWLEALPADVRSGRPQLCILHAWILFTGGQQEAAEQSLRVAEQALETQGDPRPDSSALERAPSPESERAKLEGRAATIRAFQAFFRADAPGIIHYARRALARLPENDLAWRSSVAIALADAHSVKGEIEAAHQAQLAALDACKEAGDIYLVMLTELKLATSLRFRGELRQTIEICQKQIQQADECGFSKSALVGWSLAIWGEVLAELNDLDEALQQTKRGVELTERGGALAGTGRSYLCLVRVLFSRGDLSGAEEISRKLDVLGRESDVPSWIAGEMAAWQARIWLAQGRLEEASRWAEQRGLYVDGKIERLDTPGYVALIEHVGVARLLVAKGQVKEAVVHLERLHEVAVAGGRISRAIEILTLQAIALHAGGDTDRGLAVLERALLLAEPEGFVRIFLDEGQGIAELLEKIVDGDSEIPVQYVKKVLSAFRLSRALEADDAPVEKLSERELEVLRCIAAGFSNKRITEELFISLSTVKTHARNIYGKLLVRSRTEAIVRARELGLL